MLVYEDFGEVMIRKLSLMYESLILLPLATVIQQYLHCTGASSVRSSECMNNI